MLKFAFPLSLPFVLVSQTHKFQHHWPVYGIFLLHYHSILLFLYSFSNFNKVCNFYWVEWASELSALNSEILGASHAATFILQNSCVQLFIFSSPVTCPSKAFPTSSCFWLLSYLLLVFLLFPPHSFSVMPQSFFLHCFYFHTSMRITSPLLISGLASVQNAVCKWWLCYNNLLWSGRYGASTPSAHLFPLVTTHFLILYAFPYK